MNLDTIFNYTFNDPTILHQALTHPSVSAREKEKGNNIKILNYERLEFLGDSVLGLIITEFLVKNYPDENEGLLAKRRAALVCGDILSQIAREINLGPLILMTHGEHNSGGRENPKNLENSLEAIIGALYIDGGFSVAKEIIYKFWIPIALEMKTVPNDPKTSLQEWAQKNGKAIPEYNTIFTSGPSHAPIFEIEVTVEGVLPHSGKGSSKKIAEREAAIKMLEYIKNNHDK